MKNKIGYAIRVILTLLLLFAVYKETGPFTTLSFFLTFLALELLAWAVKDNL